MVRAGLPHGVVAVLAAATLGAGCGGDEEPGETVTAPPVTVTETETVTVTETDTATADERADCGDVGFEPQTDAGAFGITSVGAPCDVARRVAAASEGRRGRSFQAEGFSCSGRPGGGQLATVEWTCTRDGAEVRFSTS